MNTLHSPLPPIITRGCLVLLCFLLTGSSTLANTYQWGGATSTNFWFVYPGSVAFTNVTITIDPTKANVFYRLVYP